MTNATQRNVRSESTRVALIAQLTADMMNLRNMVANTAGANRDNTRGQLFVVAEFLNYLVNHSQTIASCVEMADNWTTDRSDSLNADHYGSGQAKMLDFLREVRFAN